MKTAAILLACAFFTFFPGKAKAALAPPEQLAITHLLQFVRESNMQFIRNGKSYSGADAADHMEKKFSYAKDRLQYAEEFIDYVASRSSMTGEPYYVIGKSGEKQEAGKWLYAELNRYRAQEAAPSAPPEKPKKK